MLQNSIQNQPNIDPLIATLSGSGQNKNIVDSTGEIPNGNGDNDEEEDELLRNMTQEFECQEERGPHIHKKLENFTGPPVRVFKKEKLEKVVMDTLP